MYTPSQPTPCLYFTFHYWCNRPFFSPSFISTQLSFPVVFSLIFSVSYALASFRLVASSFLQFFLSFLLSFGRFSCCLSSSVEIPLIEEELDETGGGGEGDDDEDDDIYGSSSAEEGGLISGADARKANAWIASEYFHSEGSAPPPPCLCPAHCNASASFSSQHPNRREGKEDQEGNRDAPSRAQKKTGLPGKRGHVGGGGISSLTSGVRSRCRVVL